jgi:hypothetical protein
MQEVPPNVAISPFDLLPGLPRPFSSSPEPEPLQLPSDIPNITIGFPSLPGRPPAAASRPSTPSEFAWLEAGDSVPAQVLQTPVGELLQVRIRGLAPEAHPSRTRIL